MFSDILILAGGFGERLWPASSSACPKQFMSLQDGVSFFQAAVLRAFALNVQGRIVVVTRKDIQNRVAEHCRRLSEILSEKDFDRLKAQLCIIAEPCSRHTAPPVLLTLRFLQELDGGSDHFLLVLTSDHVIGPADAFAASAEAAYRQAAAGRFVCFGIEPLDASVEYGYIKRGEIISREDAAYEVEFFKEKPDKKTALAYLAAGDYWWNSGMFGFSADLFEREAAVHAPDLFKSFPSSGLDCTEIILKQTDGICVLSEWETMDRAYARVTAVSLDVAVAERTRRAVVVKASFDWYDVGSWDSFEKLFNGNPGCVVPVRSENCFVYSDIPVALCGVEGLIVVIRNGRALIVKKGESTLVREAVKKIKDAEGQTPANIKT